MKIISTFLYFILILIIPFAQASGVSIGGTRFIYEINKREINIPIFNGDKEKPYLIKSWVSSFDNNTKSPFIAMPPLFRIEPNSHGSARISYIGEPLGANQEKLYLLNIKAIPPKEGNAENELQIIINSQFKLFLRSQDMVPIDFEQVKIVKKSDGIMINNQTPYHLSIKKILIDGKKAKGIGIVYPFKNDYILKIKTTDKNLIEVKFINDYGAIVVKK